MAAQSHACSTTDQHFGLSKRTACVLSLIMSHLHVCHHTLLRHAAKCHMCPCGATDCKLADLHAWSGHLSKTHTWITSKRLLLAVMRLFCPLWIQHARIHADTAIVSLLSPAMPSQFIYTRTFGELSISQRSLSEPRSLPKEQSEAALSPAALLWSQGREASACKPAEHGCRLHAMIPCS